MNHSKKILVVEDNFQIRMMLVEFLLDEGYEVIEVDRAIKALAILKYQLVDLITLDYAMPEMDGNEFLNELSQQDEQAAAIPVIVISANIHILQAVHQVKKIMPKPFDINMLAECIEQLISHSPVSKLGNQ